MTDKTLEQKIAEIDNGRFAGLLKCIEVQDVCAQCNYFNPNINDPAKGYRCHVAPSCIAATLHPRIQSYMWMKLGWIHEDVHSKNVAELRRNI